MIYKLCAQFISCAHNLWKKNSCLFRGSVTIRFNEIEIADMTLLIFHGLWKGLMSFFSFGRKIELLITDMTFHEKLSVHEKEKLR